MLLRHVAAFNYESASERYEQVGEAMGLDLRGMRTSRKKAAILSAIETLRAELGLTCTLGSRGVRASDVSALAEQALRDACLVTNPRRPDRRDLEVIYEEAL